MKCSHKSYFLLFSALYTYHSLYPKSIGDELFHGDTIEIAMFDYTNYRIHIKANNKFRRFVIPKDLNINHDILNCNEGFEIIWNFGFDHFKHLMNVIVKYKRIGRIFLFDKGVFEAILVISDPLAIPSDFKILAEKYSADGSYIIAVAYRDINFLDLHNLENIQLLIQLDIQDLNILCIILTGDNLESTLIVAKKFGLLKYNKAEDNLINNRHIVPVENEDCIILSSKLIDNNFTLRNEKMEIVPYNEIVKTPSKYLFELTGEAYNAMENLMVISGVQSDMTEEKQSLFKVATLRDLVYSRIMMIAKSSPEDKCKVVSDFTKYGEITGMIRDGSNDSAAMHVSHLGIILTNRSTIFIATFAITSNNLGYT
ncbi:hypothetical protein ACR3K2_10060 [Cryptosporidium serpentis]